MKQFLTVLLLAVSAAPAGADEVSRNIDDPRGQLVGFVAKPYVTGGPLPKYCTEKEWEEAIEATIAETRDVPPGATAEFIRRASEVAARFGC